MAMRATLQFADLSGPDGRAGLHYNTFRYCDLQLGRFITQVPNGLGGGFNLYQYISKPMGWVDPLGWACWSPNNISGRKVYQSDDIFDPSQMDDLGRTNIQRINRDMLR